MSFLYPRTIAITRPNTNSGIGAIGYGGLTPAAETAVVSGLPASIQENKNLGKPEADVPGDALRATQWNIFIPATAAALGLIEERDIVTDDLGQRYQISTAYWNSLGYRLGADQLEA